MVAQSHRIISRGQARRGGLPLVRAHWLVGKLAPISHAFAGAVGGLMARALMRQRQRPWWKIICVGLRVFGDARRRADASREPGLPLDSRYGLAGVAWDSSISNHMRLLQLRQR